MAPLATAFVRLRSDSSMLAADVRRDASRAGATGGTVMGREFGTAFRRVSRTLIGLGIGTFAVEAGRFAIDMADKFELSRSRLETVTKNLGGNFDEISSQVQALDNRLAAFGFTNADVEGSVASLESATKSSTKALQDAALAADIARGRNISLESATQILMRVETGHVAMLSRLGIATKDANGNLLTQKAALQQLAQLYGGSAAHFADTFAGKQQALRAELGNSAAEIGVALLPAAVDLAHVLQHDILPAVQGTAEWFDRNRKTIEPLVGDIIKLTLAYKGLKAAQKLLGALSVARAGGTAAAAAGAEGGALGAFTIARPLPVYVVNKIDPGAPFPLVPPKGTGAGGAGALDIAALGARRYPLYGVGAQSDVRVPSQSLSASASLAAAGALIKQLPADLQAAARKALSGVVSQQATGSTLHNFFLGPNFKTVVDQPKLAALEAQWRKLVPTLNNAATGEHNVGRAADGTTRSVQNQAKALRQLQSKALDLSQGQDDLRSAIHNMATTAGQSGRALKGNSDAALANRDALRGAVSQAENYLSVLKQHGASAEHVRSVEFNLAKAIQTSADKTYGDASAVKAFLKQLGFLPGQIQAVIDSLSALNNPQSVFVTHTEQLAQRGIIASTGKKAGSHLADSIVAGYTPVVDSGIAAASTKAADAAAAAFDKAKSKMQADTQQILGFFKQTKQELISTFSTFQASGTDILGGSGLNANFHTQLKQGATQMHTFAHLWHRLNDLGLDPRLLAQFTGPDYIPAMREILQSGRKGIRSDNRLERQIARDARGIAQTSTDDRYGRLLHHDFETLPRKLSREMVRDLHHAKFVVEFDTGKHDRHNGRTVRQHR